MKTETKRTLIGLFIGLCLGGIFYLGIVVFDDLTSNKENTLKQIEEIKETTYIFNLVKCKELFEKKTIGSEQKRGDYQVLYNISLQKCLAGQHLKRDIEEGETAHAFVVFDVEKMPLLSKIKEDSFGDYMILVDYVEVNEFLIRIFDFKQKQGIGTPEEREEEEKEYKEIILFRKLKEEFESYGFSLGDS